MKTNRSIVCLVLSVLLMCNQAIGGDAAGVEVRRFEGRGGWVAPVHVLSSAKGNILVDPGHYSNELAPMSNRAAG